MTLIKSISGIRGTIGGESGNNLTPIEAIKFGCAYGCWLKKNISKEKLSCISCFRLTTIFDKIII